MGRGDFQGAVPLAFTKLVRATQSFRRQREPDQRATPGEVNGAYAFTAAAAASLVAPFVELDRVDIFLGSEESGARLRNLAERESSGPKLRLIYPYDNGVFLYCRREGSVPIVSNLQTYLDLYARGGRDLGKERTIS